MMIEVTLNGKKILAPSGITILELATQQGIHIPTLCHDDELNPFGSCWVCAVEVKGRKGFVTSCGTKIIPNMEIVTDSPEIHAARKMALELLISDHYADCEAPCRLACPGKVDVQTYVSLIANGQYHEAVRVIKETLPMPLSIGRVCPAFCEKECRRTIVEEPIAIRQLKRFAADMDLNDVWSYLPEKKEDTGNKIAIIGAGPSGLTCGYYLSNKGHEVKLFEAAPQAGGWLRYGIPEYRLPKDILDAEIELMCANGMQIEYNVSLGKDFTLSELSAQYDAVYLAIGAQKAVPMPVQGSELQGCLLGVDFLKAHALGNAPKLGKKVAIVGGGNTAIDCARTAIRLGCEVTVIYRRTQNEMPAEAEEVQAAIHEGVEFHYLCNPVEYLGEDGCLNSVRIERMELGEPDSSGRRRPVPTGECFCQDFDTIIAAISQVPEVELFAEEDNFIDGKELPLSRWDTAIVDEDSMYTGLGNVFAGGDFRRGPATAIEAIADGRAAAGAIDRYLNVASLRPPRLPFDAKKGASLKEVSTEEFEEIEKVSRVQMREISHQEASTTFKEVELGFSAEEAVTEAERCLECGCQVNESCKLREFCTIYGAENAHFMGSVNKHPIDYGHPFILRDTNKCINCARCLRTCAEIQGPAVLGFIYRGFAAVVAPEFGESLTQTTCESCGKCIAVCPVGALVERNMGYKMNPHPKEQTLQNCGLCGAGCYVRVLDESGVVCLVDTSSEDDMPSFHGKNLCFKGRFGWQTLVSEDRLTMPMVKEKGKFREVTWSQAREIIQGKSIASQTRRVQVSPFITLEEMLIAKAVSHNIGSEFCADARYLHLGAETYMQNPDPEPYKKLDDFEEYVVCSPIDSVLRTLLRLKQRKGKKLILIGEHNAPWHKFVDETYKTIRSLPYGTDRLYIYNMDHISASDALKVWKKARTEANYPDNVMVGSDAPNLGGLIAVEPSFAPAAKADFILSWGEPFKKKDKDAFKVALCLYKDENPDADIILPASSYLDLDGCALGNYGVVSFFKNPAKSKYINELLKLFYEMDFISPTLADVNNWNTMANNLLDELIDRQIPTFDPAAIDKTAPAKIKPRKLSYLEERMQQLYETRKHPMEFGGATQQFSLTGLDLDH